MTARVTLACDGRIGGADGYDCRQATPVGAPRNGSHARAVAHHAHGWRAATRLTATGHVHLLDLCPPCARRAVEHPDPAVRLIPPADVDHVDGLIGGPR